MKMNNNKPPILNHRGQVVNAPQQDPNPFLQLFMPTYVGLVSAVIVAHPSATPQEVADLAVEHTKVALARVGFNFDFKENADAQP